MGGRLWIQDSDTPLYGWVHMHFGFAPDFQIRGLDQLTTSQDQYITLRGSDITRGLYLPLGDH